MLVVASPVPHAHRLGHGDLDVVDVVAVPNGLEKGVGEAEGEDVLHGLLAQVVVDPVDLALVEKAGKGGVEPLRRSQVLPKRLLNHDARRQRRKPRRFQALRNHPDQRRRRGEVEDHLERTSVFGQPGEVLGQRLVRLGVAKVGFEKAERLRKAFPRVRVGVAVAGKLIDAFFEVLAEGVVGEAFLVEADEVERPGR